MMIRFPEKSGRHWINRGKTLMMRIKRIFIGYARIAMSTKR
jgi:hypothetical protein